VDFTDDDGKKRVFNAAPLAPTQRYYYDVTVKWGFGADEQAQTRRVYFVPGEHQSVHFNKQTTNYGMNWQPNGQAEKFTLGAREITKQEAKQAIQASLTDDSMKPRLTFIGPALPLSPGLADKFLAQTYDPAHWVVKKYGFAHQGKTTVYLQRPDGTVALRMVDPSPDALVAALRKKSPDYDPAKDPDGRPRPELPWDLLMPAFATVLTVGLVLAWLWLQRKKT
jgi:hypothetical protein